MNLPQREEVDCALKDESRAYGDVLLITLADTGEGIFAFPL